VELQIVIIGTSKPDGSFERIRMFTDFLRSRNHKVDLLQFPGQSLNFGVWYYYQLARARFQGKEERHMKKIADLLELKIRKGKYDAVICVAAPFSYVLTRKLGCLKVYACESLGADEMYFSKAYGDLERIHKLREMELEILMKSDYVLFPWKTTEDYTRKYIWNGDNFLTIRFGCNPQNKRASYFFPPSIISLGSLAPSWVNKELISYLTNKSPYTIHVYGKDKSPKKYNLNYKGFAPSMDVLSKYQFGLNTISKDIFRQNHFSSRVLTYLSYGLPTLSPDWMKLTNTLRGVLPYNEENFLKVIDEYSESEKWKRLSDEAYQQAIDLDWREVLKPLEQIIPTG
jgi:hypothetical protein